MCKKPKCDIKKALISLCYLPILFTHYQFLMNGRKKTINLERINGVKSQKKHDFFNKKLCCLFDCHVKMSEYFISL